MGTEPRDARPRSMSDAALSPLPAVGARKLTSSMLSALTGSSAVLRKELNVKICLRFLPVLMVLVLSVGCADDPPTAAAPASQVQSTEGIAVQVGIKPATLDSIALVVSVALRDSQFRHTLFSDLRDSRFPYHAIHLTSYALGAIRDRIAPVVDRELGAGAWKRFASDLAGLPPPAALD